MECRIYHSIAELSPHDDAQLFFDKNIHLLWWWLNADRTQALQQALPSHNVHLRHAPGSFRKYIPSLHPRRAMVDIAGGAEEAISLSGLRDLG